MDREQVITVCRSSIEDQIETAEHMIAFYQRRLDQLRGMRDMTVTTRFEILSDTKEQS